MNQDSIARILEAFAYIAEKISPVQKNNMYNVLKVFYLADKLHMDRYGRFIFDDTYAAMKKGPVPSQAYDLLKMIKSGQKLPYNLDSSIEFKSDYIVIPNRAADLDYFSGSDIICLDEVISLSKDKDLGDLSHDKAWLSTKCNAIMRTEDIILTLENSKHLLDLHKNRYA